MSHVDPPVMELVGNVKGTEVGKRASCDYGRRGRVGVGASPVSRLDVSTIPPHRNSPVRPPVSSPDSPVYLDVHVRTNDRSIYDVISRIEGIIAAQEDSEDAQSFVDAVYEVRPQAPSLPGRSVLSPCPLLSPFYISEISPSRL